MEKKNTHMVGLLIIELTGACVFCFFRLEQLQRKESITYDSLLSVGIWGNRICVQSILLLLCLWKPTDGVTFVALIWGHRYSIFHSLQCSVYSILTGVRRHHIFMEQISFLHISLGEKWKMELSLFLFWNSAFWAKGNTFEGEKNTLTSTYNSRNLVFICNEMGSYWDTEGIWLDDLCFK